MLQRRADLAERRLRCEALLADFERLTPEEMPLEARGYAKAAHVAEIARIDRSLRDLEGLDEQAAERDRLAANRPPGCVCLGLGGTGVLTLPDADPPTPIWSRPCSCPEGRAQVAAYDALILSERAATLERDLEEQRARNAEQTAIRKRRSNLPELHYGHLRWADFEREPGKADATAKLRAMAQSQRASRALLFGGFGTGKSALAFLLLRDWLEAGRGGIWTPAADYLDALRPPDDGRTPRLSREQADGCMRCGLLILDDVGAERLTAWGRDALFRLLNGRLTDGLPTIATSNYAPADLAHRLADGADVREGQRLVERLMEPPTELLHVGGRNYRYPEGVHAAQTRVD